MMTKYNVILLGSYQLYCTSWKFPFSPVVKEGVQSSAQEFQKPIYVIQVACSKYLHLPTPRLCVSVFYGIFVCFLVTPGSIKPSILHIQGKCSTTELHDYP